MTDQEIAQRVAAELILTTDPYPTWVKKGKPPTHWANAFNLLNQIGAPPPPINSLKGFYSFTEASQMWPSCHSETGANLLIVGGDDPNGLAALRATGSKAWATAGYWNDSTGAFSLSDQQALSIAKNVAAQWSDVVVGWYVADEPSKTPSVIAGRSALLQSAFDVETIAAMWNTGIFNQFKNSVDAYALDGYPSRNNWNMATITDQASAADAIGMPYYGVVGAFTDGTSNYPLPSPQQLQQMITTWDSTKQKGVMYYAWGATGGSTATHLENQPALLNIIKEN